MTWRFVIQGCSTLSTLGCLNLGRHNLYGLQFELILSSGCLNLGSHAMEVVTMCTKICYAQI